jgi:hypothetical protein
MLVQKQALIFFNTPYQVTIQNFEKSTKIPQAERCTERGRENLINSREA